MNAQSLQSVLVLLAQILGPFGQTWIFHKFGWVFHTFTENGKFYIVWIHTIRHKNKDACHSPLIILSWFTNVSMTKYSQHNCNPTGYDIKNPCCSLEFISMSLKLSQSRAWHWCWNTYSSRKCLNIDNNIIK